MVEYQYPDVEDLLLIHERMLTLYGGHKGIRQKRYLNTIFKSIIEDTKKEPDIHRQAAILLKKLSTLNLFEDANKRTAFATTMVFLSINGMTMKIKYEDAETLKFLKDIRNFNIDEITEWVKRGST